MTLQPEQRRAVDDALLEALLQQVYEGDPHEPQRIASMLASLPTRSLQTEHRVPLARGRWRRCASLALAASVLLVAAYASTYLTSSSAAYAAVMRSRAVAPTSRAYQIRMVHQRPIWGKREVTADLYCNDHDQFVVRHPGWARLGDVWIGGEGKKRWIAPRFGPAYTGGEEIVGGWLSRKDIPSPYLHVTTILENMSRVYSLTMLDDTPLPRSDALESAESSDSSARCQHVVGKRRGSNRARPARIELWADIDTGMVRRLELTWQRRKSERGPLSWTIDWAGSPELPHNWFDLEGHTAPGRPVIPVRSTAELEATENETP